ncbi:MAG: hypothetical protein JNL28_01445 [Planctomycetes bacterium]|nr:hypothetical protein [Planctomycetota bacterium]
MITGVGSFAFDNTAATTDGLADPACNFASQSQINKDVWYSWTATATGPFRFDTCGQTSLDTKIAVYDGSCAGALLACDDDACTVGLQSSIDVNVTAGNVYIVRLGSYSTTVGGTGTFSIAVIPPLAVLDTQINPANGRTYHLLAAATWTNAEARAIQLGGHLATVDSPAENEWIRSTWQNFQGTPHDLWIGFNDAAVEGTFVWADGSPVTYTNWDAGEPNNALTGEDYTNIRRDSPTGNWNDLGNNPTGYFNAVFGVVEIGSTSTTSFCLGDGTGAPCPCANTGAVGHGCASSAFAGGAILTSSGTAGASAGTDTLVLTATDIPGPGLFFQSNSLLAAPANFGDGHLCAAVGIVRLGVVFPTSGVASYPGGLTPNPIHIQGGTANGQTKYYQCWYRSVPGLCGPNNYDLTQGLSLSWGP